MKKKDRMRELEALSPAALEEELLRLKRSYFFLRCRQQVDKLSEFRTLRRDIARVMTAYNKMKIEMAHKGEADSSVSVSKRRSGR